MRNLLISENGFGAMYVVGEIGQKGSLVKNGIVNFNPRKRQKFK